MALYPGGDGERRVLAGALRALVGAIFERCGMTRRDAGLLAGSLVMADLRGVHSHGVLRVPEYVGKLTEGGVNPTGQPRVVTDAVAALVVDGGNSMGQIGAAFAMEQAIGRARAVNVAVAAVRGSNHCGAMAPYAMQALDADMIGIAASHTLPVMAPWGSIDRILGISPLAVAIPAADETPIVLDLAFSAAAVGKIKVYQQKGLTIPPDWAFDNEGRPTTDPAVALMGLLQPIGGYKGTGLALAFGMMASLLSGALYGTELGNIHDGPVPGGDAHLMMALNVAAFEDLDRFKRRVDGIVRQMRESRRAPGVERVYSPGEVEAETAARYEREGIPLNAVTVAGIVEAAGQLGLDAAAVR